MVLTTQTFGERYTVSHKSETCFIYTTGGEMYQFMIGELGKGATKVLQDS